VFRHVSMVSWRWRLPQCSRDARDAGGGVEATDLGIIKAAARTGDSFVIANG
jgi:hypothetical protein